MPTGNQESQATPGAPTDQAIELAEIMLSMGLAHGAAQALSDQIRDNPKRALYHWLKLLDVYRRSGMKADFERTAQELRQSFNVQSGQWDDGKPVGSADDGNRTTLENFPHLSRRLMELWPTPACAEYLENLLKDNRGGTRAGFPPEVAEEILLLRQMLGHSASNLQ